MLKVVTIDPKDLICTSPTVDETEIKEGYGPEE